MIINVLNYKKTFQFLEQERMRPGKEMSMHRERGEKGGDKK
jgi:hypothetical protein